MTPPKRIEIARLPQNKRFAITTSWDDGVIEDRRLIAFMNEHGLKGTFNLNSGSLNRPGRDRIENKIDASEVASLYAGHEVAIHTVTHPHLPMLDASAVALEVLEDRKALEDLVGYPVRGMAYPFGTYSQKVIEILRSLGIVYARTVERVEPCFPPKEPLAWPATAHMFTREPDDIATRFSKMLEHPHARGVYFIWGHTYEFARPADRWAEMETLFAPLAGHDCVWYCTNIELFDYEAARQRVVIAANKLTAYNPSAIPVTLIVDGRPVEAIPGKVVSLAS
jgi:peptidoglycan/xylan/chitin deacetylase (PgdA/CDA1 family)